MPSTHINEADVRGNWDEAVIRRHVPKDWSRTGVLITYPPRCEKCARRKGLIVELNRFEAIRADMPRRYFILQCPKCLHTFPGGQGDQLTEAEYAQYNGGK